MSHVVSMRLRDEQLARLKRYARRLGKTLGETSALLVEEKLREAEFALIEFRNSSLGRQAYMKGSRLTVWWVIHVAKTYFDMDAERVATHFRRPVAWVKAAFHYYQAFPEEIEQAIEDHLAADFEGLKRMLPNARQVTIPLDEE